MFKPKTYLDLCMAMKARAVVDIDQTVGVINGIRTEDGSGSRWIVTVVPQQEHGMKGVEVYVRE
jgi:hypothetical protein